MVVLKGPKFLPQYKQDACSGSSHVDGAKGVICPVCHQWPST